MRQINGHQYVQNQRNFLQPLNKTPFKISSLSSPKVLHISYILIKLNCFCLGEIIWYHSEPFKAFPIIITKLLRVLTYKSIALYCIFYYLLFSYRLDSYSYPNLIKYLIVIWNKYSKQVDFYFFLNSGIWSKSYLSFKCSYSSYIFYTVFPRKKHSSLSWCYGTTRTDISKSL